MATPSYIPIDWSPEFSIEDCNSAYNYGGTPSVADGQVSQCLDAPTPALYIDSQGQQRWSRSTSRTPLEPPQESLDFVRYEDWDPDATYGNVPSTCIQYRVDWSVKIDRTVISRNTEEDIVLEPTSYGPLVLQPRLEELLKRKIIPPRSVQAQDTDVTLKVADRSADDFVTQYKETSIDWVQVQRRLLTWSELFRKGKKLRVNIIFRYTEVGSSTAMNGSRTKGNQVRGTATQRMQADRTAELNAVQATTGEPAAWQHVYALFRCPGAPCDLKPWCWFDSQQHRRFALKSHHIRALIRYVESGNTLDTHDQMPEDLRQQIYREEEQSSKHKQTNHIAQSSGLQPIQITNVLPSHASVQAETAPPAELSPLDLIGLRDENVQEYCNWQQSQVRRPSWKAQFQKATDFVLEKCFDLDLLLRHQTPQLLVDKAGIEEGIAGQYFRDIKPWAKRRKLSHPSDLTAS